MRKALRALVEVDIKQNHGVLRNVEKIAWDLEHGTEVDFVIDGKVHVNGEGGLLNYLLGTALVNPHLTLHYVLPGLEPKTLGRVSTEIPRIPQPTVPHPHTMKLGEFLSYAHLFQKVKVRKWLKEGFSRVTDRTLEELHQIGKIPKKVFQKTVSQLDKKTLLLLFEKFQALNLRAPSTHSVISVGEERLSKSMARLGKMDFFSVLTRKPTICDLKPVQVEVALGRFQELPARSEEKAVQVLRFANRVPLQFDKASCAIFKSITSVNWRAYGLVQHKGGVPLGPYVFAVSVVSPFIQFKNASKETIDASEQLVEEIRRALMQAGQKLSRYIRKEKKAQELEEKKRHIEQFGPILVETLCRIAKVGDRRKKKALLGLQKILGRDADQSEQALVEAQKRLRAQMQKEKALQQVSGEQKKEDQKKQRKEEKSKSSRSIKPVSLDTTL